MLTYLTTLSRLERAIKHLRDVSGLVKPDVLVDKLAEEFGSPRCAKYALRDLAKTGFVVFTDKFQRPHLVCRFMYIDKVFVDSLVLDLVENNVEKLPYIVAVTNPALFEIGNSLAANRKYYMQANHASIRLLKLLSEASPSCIAIRSRMRVLFSRSYISYIASEKTRLLIVARAIYLLSRIRNSSQVRLDTVQLTLKLMHYKLDSVEELVKRLVDYGAPLRLQDGIVHVGPELESWLREMLARS